jgi:hypothetical protein
MQEHSQNMDSHMRVKMGERRSSTRSILLASALTCIHPAMPSSTHYPPYGQSIHRVAVPGESEQERAAYRNESQEYTQNSSYPGMAMHPLPPAAAHDRAREASSQSYASYPDSAYATVGSQSRENSNTNTPQAYNTRSQPPRYASPVQNGAPPVNQQDANYPRAQVANGHPASYPNTYTEQQQQQHPAKPAPSGEVVGKGWAGFSLQDIRDLSPKAKKRLIW